MHIESQNHRIISVGRDSFKGHLVQLPYNEQGHLQLHHAAQSPIQPDPECSQGQDIHHQSGQPVPVSHDPYCKKSLPYT